MPEKSPTGELKKGKYGVKIKSVQKEGDVYTIRVSSKSETNVRRAKGPLHYALAIVPRTLTPPVFYVNGVKFVPVLDPSFRAKQKSTTTLIKETYGKK